MDGAEVSSGRTMAQGRKIGGRIKVTPNKATAGIKAAFEDRPCRRCEFFVVLEAGRGGQV